MFSWLGDLKNAVSAFKSASLSWHDEIKGGVLITSWRAS